MASTSFTLQTTDGTTMDLTTSNIPTTIQKSTAYTTLLESTAPVTSAAQSTAAVSTDVATTIAASTSADTTSLPATTAHMTTMKYTSTTEPLVPQDCYEILNTYGRNTSGIYWIYPMVNGTSSPTSMQVWCDMETDGGGWTVFQRRVDGSENFYRYWADYKAGFGDLEVEHWLGNDNIYALVNNGNTYELRLDLNDGSEWKYDLYASFVISDEAGEYTLTLGADIGGEAGNSFNYQNSQAFTTRDADNDVWKNGNCALTTKGGWWYVACHQSNLNGLYLNGPYSSSRREGMEYQSWKGSKYSLAATEMKVRPAHLVFIG
ncbi:techylectin-5A-like [Amphiura filiformis]|uniref:techylectin-5A-like n=1 Tax=Amphiura filiformis TaxID=82378 RepID=UPI003B21E28E